MKRNRWYFIVTFTNGTKNAEWDLTKKAAKLLYEYHTKNMLMLNVQRATFGQLDKG